MKSLFACVGFCTCCRVFIGVLGPRFVSLELKFLFYFMKKPEKGKHVQLHTLVGDTIRWVQRVTKWKFTMTMIHEIHNTCFMKELSVR